MNIGFVWKAIIDRMLADTGAGGLFQTGSPLITTVYVGQAPASTAYPYIQITQAAETEEDTFAKDAVELDVYFNVYATYDTANSRTTVDTITTRLRTLFHRFVLTPPTGSNILFSAAQRTGSIDNSDRDTIQIVEAYTFRAQSA